MKRKSLPWVDHPTVRQVCDNPWWIPWSWSKLKMDTAKVNSVRIPLSRGYEICLLCPLYMWKIECSWWGYLSGTTTPGVKGMKPEFPFKLQHACSHVRSVWDLQTNDGSASYFCMQPTMICTRGFDPLFMWSSMMLSRWAKLTDRSVKKLTCERHR